jgi:hypothetical protein
MVASGLRGLAALGLEIPADPSKEMLDKAVAEVNELLGKRPISDLLHSPPATDERAKACSFPTSWYVRNVPLITDVCAFAGNPDFDQQDGDRVHLHQSPGLHLRPRQRGTRGFHHLAFTTFEIGLAKTQHPCIRVSAD